MAASKTPEAPEASKAPEAPNKGGRPTVYTEAVADEICERIAAGEALTIMCQDEHMPCETQVYHWLAHDSFVGFAERYAQARERQADKFASLVASIGLDGVNLDGTAKIVSNETTQARRLACDSLKWSAAKLAPQKYGDRIQQDITTNGEGLSGVLAEVATRSSARSLHDPGRPKGEPLQFLATGTDDAGGETGEADKVT